LENSWTNFRLLAEPWAKFSTLEVAACVILCTYGPGVAKQPNLELKTWPKQLLGSLPLVIALPGKLNMVLMLYYKKISSWVIDIKAVKAPYCHLYYETIDNCFSHKKLTKNYDCLLVSSAISNIVGKF
jgi:hypothetical protein